MCAPGSSEHQEGSRLRGPPGEKAAVCQGSGYYGRSPGLFGSNFSTYS